MSTRSWLTIIALVVAVVPLSGVGAAPANCTVRTAPAIDLGQGMYLHNARELWEESNGEPGLQRTPSFCSGGSTIPADTCITHSETFAALNCGITFVGGL